jgi:hypothetical protein
MSTVIESLPNELWREVFKYFDGNKLFKVFYGLNRRIDGALVETVNLNLKLDTEEDYRYCVETILVATGSFANIKAMTLRYTAQSIPFFSFYSLNMFTQLRSLKWLYFPAEDAIKQSSLVHQLESLEVLLSGNDKIDVQYFLTAILSGESNSSNSMLRLSLKNDTVPYDMITSPGHPIQKMTNLQHLNIGWVQYDDFLLIMPSLEQASSVTARLYVNKTTTILPTILLQCKKLNLDFAYNCHGEFEAVQFLLQCTPNLEDLTISCPSLSFRENAQQWTLLCAKLLKFELKVRLRDHNTYRVINPVKSTFQTNFWRTRNTTVKYEGCPYTAFIVKFNLKVGLVERVFVF